MAMDEVRFLGLINRAAASGAIYENYAFHWNLSHNCEDPYIRCIDGRLSPTFDPSKLKALTVTQNMRGLPLQVILKLRCRRCEACKKAKRNSWSYRAKSECAKSQRNWFVTLTLGNLFRDAIPMDKRLIEMQKLVTKYFKRLRKNTGAKFRYLCVFELHKDGTPHAHLIMHDTDSRLRERTITHTWLAGFSQARLVNIDKSHNAVHYVVKYLTKDTQSRVRSSLHYGLDHSPSETTDVINPDPNPPPEETLQGGEWPERE